MVSPQMILSFPSTLVIAPPLVIPAKAGIQYAGKPAIKPIGRGVLGRPVKPGDDSGV